MWYHGSNEVMDKGVAGMTDKKHEGVEKEMNMPDAETIEDRTLTTGPGSGEEMTKSKLEQQTSDAEKSDGKTQTIGRNSGEGTGDHDSGQRTMETEESENAAQTNGTGESKGGSKPEREKRTSAFDIFVGIAQILASIAAVVAAAVAFSSLNEMQEERNNAYRPEIVVAPNTFEGGEIVEGKDLPDKKIMYIDQTSRSPDLFYVDNPSDSIGYLYLEIPYLTLKNIGQGTARDVQISFSRDWMEEVVELLNRYEDDSDYAFKIDADGSREYFRLDYSGLDGGNRLYLSSSDDLVKRFTYISADEASVNVPIPECWKRLFAVLYGQAIYTEYKPGVVHRGLSQAPHELTIPDAIISITYSDMQGILREDEMVIPWTGQFYKRMLPEETVRTVHLKTGFYEDYIR